MNLNGSTIISAHTMYSSERRTNEGLLTMNGIWDIVGALVY